MRLVPLCGSFSILWHAFLWDWNENWPFPVLWPLLNIPNFLAYWMQHFHSTSFRIWNSSTWIQSPPLVLFSTFAWKILWMEEPGELQSMGSLELDTTKRLHFHFSLSCTGEGNGNPLQCSCLENPRDGEAWWAAVYGVTQSRTRLKRLSSSSSML